MDSNGRVSFEPFDARVGCLAFPISGLWVVVAPNGKLLTCTGDDEYEARTVAMYRNLTATGEERKGWTNAVHAR